MFMPVHGSYLAAVIAILVFVLLLLLQTDLLASNNRYLWWNSFLSVEPYLWFWLMQQVEYKDLEYYIII